MNPIVALQMDPLTQIRAETDTTVALGLEAQNRGYRLFAYTPEALTFNEGQIIAKGQWITLRSDPKDFYHLGQEEHLNLADARFVLMRQDPPFNMSYIAATHLLELLPDTTRVINDPVGVRNAPEKLLPTLFPSLMPPTLMTWDRSLIDGFIATHESVILKPLFDFGGNGVLLIQKNDPNLTVILETYRRLYQEPPIFQKFLPEIAKGDKRIILIDGKPLGIIKRVPPKGQARSNMRIGGQAEKCEFSPRDLQICTQIGPTLKDRGLYLAGIDVIGDSLTEINVTSPTGLPVIHCLYGHNLAKDFWDGLEAD